MVIKYGVPIGKASEDIRTGDYVHTHNVEDITTALCEAYAAEYRRKAAQS
jgi:altronate hydrolase